MSVKYIPVKSMRQLADFDFQRYFVEVPHDMTTEDLFKPITWAHHVRTLRKYDVVRCVAHDGSYDFDLTVLNIEGGGITMGLRPHIAGKVGEEALVALSQVAASVNTTSVPIEKDGLPRVRVEYLAATKWRVIGMNGEVSRDHPSEAKAKKAMQEYITANALVMPKLMPSSPNPDKKDAA